MPTLNPEALIAAGPSSEQSINDRMQVDLPPPSPEGDQVIDLDIFESVKSGNKVTREELNKANVPPSPTPEDKKVKEELDKEEAEALKKHETKEEVKEEKPVEKKEDLPKPPPTAKLPKPPAPSSEEIDFKDLVSETAIPLLKKASRETQEFVAAELRRNKVALEAARAEAEVAKKSVKEGLPSAWYEHENAYMLTPEYQQAVTKANTLQTYSKHFREQMIRNESGEKWVDLVVDANGKVQQVVKEAGPSAKVELMDRIRSFDDAIKQTEEKANVLASKFSQQAKSFRDDMRKAEDEFFPQYKDAFDKNENGKYVMNVLQAKGQSGNPLAGFTAKIYAFALEESERADKLEAELNKGKKIAAVNNGPTGGEIDHGDKTPSAPKDIEDQPFDPAAFDAVINRTR